MKVIFLDVDGILAYSSYRNADTADIDVEKVKLLKEICDKTDAKVVIISSWRGSEKHTPQIYYILRSVLEKYHIEVLGDAPHIRTEFEDDVPSLIALTTLEALDSIKIKYGTGRAAEVKKWLEEHPEVDSFVILDDEDFNWSDYGYDKHWVQPTWFDDGGLKREHVEKSIKILNKET